MRRKAFVLAAVVVVSGCSVDPLQHLPLDGRPSAVAILGDLVWIADDGEHVVRTVDTETGRITGEAVRVPRNPVALAAGFDAVWVGHATGEVTRIDARTRRPQTIDAGGSITGIAVGESRVWAADLEAKSLVEIDADVFAVDRVYRLDEGAVRVTTAGGQIWVTNSERTVTRVDPRSRDVGPVVPTGLGPIGLVSDGQRVWVANSDDGTITVVDARRGRAVGRPVPVGRGPVALALAEDSVFVTNQDDRTLVRVEGGSVGEPIDLGLSPRGIAAAAGAVWVVGTNPSGAVRVDL